MTSVPHSLPMLEVRDLETEFSTRRGTVHAVNGVSFSVGQGEVVGIVGESGCGKSVTVQSILGLIAAPGRVVGGRVELNGRDLLRMSKASLRRVRGAEIGFVAQNPFGILNPVLKIRQQFHNMMRAHRPGVTRMQSAEAALTMLQSVGIPGPERVLDGYAHELSGGMAQRVGISMALLLDPKLVIADEPTTALDVTVQRQILDLIGGLMAAGGRSMLLVTHDLGVVAQYCQKVVVLYAGKVVESGPTPQVFRAPSHPYTLALLQAVPRPGKALVDLPGRLPSLIDYPKGCPFRFRCRFAFSRCETEEPMPRPLSAQTRERSCHLDAEEVLSRGAASV